MKQYKKRIADEILKFKLESKGAVLIEGAKWCGKTTTAKQVAKSVVVMQDQDKSSSNIELANIKPSALLEGETPRLIDEWQVAPKLWDAVRYEVDERDEFGMDSSDFESMFDELYNLYGIVVDIHYPLIEYPFNKEQTVQSFIDTVNYHLSIRA